MIEEKQMKTVKVVAAIICDDIKEKNKIFATARGYGELKGGWEFPGGKVEPGETSQQALIREIIEELDTEIKVGELIDMVEYDYPTFHLSMDCFWAEVKAGHLELKEAEAAKYSFLLKILKFLIVRLLLSVYKFLTKIQSVSHS